MNLALNPGFDFSEIRVPVGSLLIVVSLLFKLSAAPFPLWLPVFDGATMAARIRDREVGYFSILVSIGSAVNMLLVGILFSLVVGALDALNQTKVKQLLAYSGVGYTFQKLIGILGF